MNEEQKPEAPAVQSAPAPASEQDQVAKKEAASQSVYPDPDQIKTATARPFSPTSPSEQERGFSLAAAAMDEGLTLALGVASSVSYLLVVYFIKSFWGATAVGGVLAVLAVYFAVRNYSSSGKITPFTVIGLAAATTTLVGVLNTLLARALLSSALSGITY